MATFVSLINWTDQGVKSFRDSGKRADAFTELISGGLAVALSSRDYENLWGKVFGFAISLGVVVAGRWLIRNRRPPFKPPPVDNA